MKWYLVSSKPDDYGACVQGLIKCKKSDLKYVYYFKEIPEKEEHKKECHNCDEYTARLGELETENRMLKSELEKQSKEIEELKEIDSANLAYYDQIYQNGIYTGQKAVEDKIKATIEQLDNEKRQWIEDRNNKHKDSEIIYAIEVLQSFLEKE